jgi:DNA-binding PadR family transcriptional regulator
MDMSLRFAILTSLSERASSGIELTRRFDRSIGYFWSATHQQIYREIGQLTAEGLVVANNRTQPVGRGTPRELSITSRGIEALGDWLAEIDEPTAPREAIMIRVRAAAATGEIAGLRPVIEHHLAVHEATLAAYQEIERRDFEVLPDLRLRLGHLVLRGGLLLEQAWAEWCREALSVLDAIEDSASTSSSH